MHEVINFKSIHHSKEIYQESTHTDYLSVVISDPHTTETVTWHYPFEFVRHLFSEDCVLVPFGLF
jgi:hypothetical protein